MFDRDEKTEQGCGGERTRMIEESMVKKGEENRGKHERKIEESVNVCRRETRKTRTQTSHALDAQWT